MLDSPLRGLYRARGYSSGSKLFQVILILLPIFCSIGLAQIHKDTGDYESLSTRQKALISHYNTYLKEKSSITGGPQSMYDGWPQSYRATFEAVSNALEKTTLTDRAKGKPVIALDLIEAMEGVAGEADGKRWDEQFRIYAVLRADALRVVTHSVQLHRQPDNVFYHSGYPLNFRTSGTPFLELSLTPDGKRAEIAINYQSGIGFPGELLDSRLAAANFDVRRGQNDVRYSARWGGLDSWWKNIAGVMGVPSKAFEESTQKSVEDLSPSPPAEGSSLSDAVEEFLHTWLVEQQPDHSLGYFDNVALACVDGPANATANSRRMRLYHEMELTNQVIGKIDSASEAVLSAPSAGGSRATYDGLPVPDREVPVVLCGTTPQVSSSVYSVSFRLARPQKDEVLMRQYWHKSDSGWKIVAYRAERDPETTPPAPKPPEVDGNVRTPSIPGEPEMITSAIQFLKDWLVLQNIDGAVAFLAPSARQCFPKGAGSEEIVETFRIASNGVESRESLQTVALPITPWNGRLPTVEHLYSSAFAILQPTSSVLASLRCGPSTRRNGVAYVTSFALRTASGEGAGIGFVWEPVDDEWQITSWGLLQH